MYATDVNSSMLPRPSAVDTLCSLLDWTRKSNAGAAPIRQAHPLAPRLVYSIVLVECLLPGRSPYNLSDIVRTVDRLSDVGTKTDTLRAMRKRALEHLTNPAPRPAGAEEVDQSWLAQFAISALETMIHMDPDEAREVIIDARSIAEYVTP